MGYCIIIEIIILAVLARMGCVAHYVANLVAAFLAITIFGVVVVEHDLLSWQILVYVLVAFFVGVGGQIFWYAVRYPLAALVALDEVSMQNAAAKSLAKDEKDRFSYGNWRLAQELVRKLKKDNDGA